MGNKAYSILEIKSVDADKRELTGIATTPTPDRSRDIIEPFGVKHAAEIPFLWQHEHGKPVGLAKLGVPTKKGVPFVATIAKIDEAGPLKDITDMAWQSIKAGLVRGVSIGFKSLSHEYLDNGGIKFTEIDVYELSAVTVPANAEATITSIKHYATPADERPVKLLQPRDDDLKGAVKLTA